MQITASKLIANTTVTSRQIGNRRQKSLKAVESLYVREEDKQAGGDHPDADRAVERGKLAIRVKPVADLPGDAGQHQQASIERRGDR